MYSPFICFAVVSTGRLQSCDSLQTMIQFYVNLLDRGSEKNRKYDSPFLVVEQGVVWSSFPLTPTKTLPGEFLIERNFKYNAPTYRVRCTSALQQMAIDFYLGNTRAVRVCNVFLTTGIYHNIPVSIYRTLCSVYLW